MADVTSGNKIRGTDSQTMEVVDRLQGLSAALIARDLQVRIDAPMATLTAINPAASGTGEIIGQAMNPGLKQVVALAVHDDNSLHWYWSWPGPTRGSGPEYEYLAPARDLELVADKVAQVIRLDPMLGG